MNAPIRTNLTRVVCVESSKVPLYQCLTCSSLRSRFSAAGGADVRSTCAGDIRCGSVGARRGRSINVFQRSGGCDSGQDGGDQRQLAFESRQPSSTSRERAAKYRA